MTRSEGVYSNDEGGLLDDVTPFCVIFRAAEPRILFTFEINDIVENRKFTILVAVSNIIFQLTGLRMMTIDVTFDERFHFLVHLIATEIYYKTLFG